MMNKKTVINFSITSLDDIEMKGNVNYVKHYLEYFDEYIGVYVWGSRQRTISSEKTKLICIGTGRGYKDLLLSPWRVYKVAKLYNVTHYLTADLIYGWWHSLFIRILFGAKIVTMPVCTPPEIKKNTGQTYSGYPMFLEKLLIHLTFASSHSILVTKNSIPDQKWINSLWCREKMVIARATPEELPAPEFTDTLSELGEEIGAFRKRQDDEPIRLVYLGRLEKEKLVFDLIRIAEKLSQNEVKFEFSIIGDGTVRQQMEDEVEMRKLADKVRFTGYLGADKVAIELSQHDIFVSTLTGTALKEAGLSRLAVVAYKIDYIAEIYKHGETCLFTEGGDIKRMANNIAHLSGDGKLRKELAMRVHQFTMEQWSPDAVRIGLTEVFEGV